MSQQTRKDPRAKVLSMTVRYKSATLDEFIEHHSHDVSRGGMFIKTPQPFPPGTLLKFEVRIAEDQKVMQGVGRVVWKREGASVDPERPGGMGVKYIKLDDESRRVIDQLLSARAEETSAFDAESAADVEGESQVGLGLSGMPTSREGDAPSSTSFFPKNEPLVMPPPEDRTVMKQAAELLEEALREVGGDAGSEAESPGDPEHKPLSLAPAGDEAEVTKPGRPSAESSSLARLPTPKVPVVAKEPAKSAEQVAGDLVASAKAAASVRPDKAADDRHSGKSSVAGISRPSAGLPTQPATPKPLRSGPEGVRPSGAKPAAAVPSQLHKEPAKASSGRGVFWGLAVAASVGAIYWVTRPSPVPPPAPEAPPIQANVEPANTPQEPAAPVPSVATEPDTVASAAAVPSEAPAASSVATVAAPSTVAPTAPLPAVVPPAPVAAKAKAKVAPKEESTPAPAATEESPTPPAETKPAEVKPAEVKPAEPQAEVPTEAPPTPAVSTPKPKKATAPAVSDNPY